MACLVVAEDLRDLIGSVLLSIVTSSELLVNESIFEATKFIEKNARVEEPEDEMEHDHNASGDEVNQLDLDFTDDQTNFQD